MPNYVTGDNSQVMLVDIDYGAGRHPDMTLTALQTTFQDHLAGSIPFTKNIRRTV